MPRFYFHSNHPAERNVKDDAGLDFATLNDAKCHAVVYAGELLCNAKQHFWETADFELTVTDEKGLILFSCGSSGPKRRPSACARPQTSEAVALGRPSIANRRGHQAVSGRIIADQDRGERRNRARSRSAGMNAARR